MITFNHVIFKYNKLQPFDFNVHTQFKKNRITGLIGPNGSGKTTLLHMLVTALKPMSGSVMLDEKPIFENPLVVDDIQYITSPYPNQARTIHTTFHIYKRDDPKFDESYALRLLDIFGFKPKMNMTKLSRGEVAVVYAIIGLAIKTKVTLFDEIELGMDDALRMKFYEQVLLEQQNNPRTIIISTNIFTETQTIFDEVKMMNQGMIVFEDQYQSVLEDYVIIKSKTTDEFIIKNSLKTIQTQYWYKSLLKKNDIKNNTNYLVEKPTLEDVFEVLTQKEVHI